MKISSIANSNILKELRASRNNMLIYLKIERNANRIIMSMLWILLLLIKKILTKNYRYNQVKKWGQKMLMKKIDGRERISWGYISFLKIEMIKWNMVKL